MIWNVPEMWDGADVFIIGGGTSLIDFDFSPLRNENVIGCNDAYILGHEICDVCVFGDAAWYQIHGRRLAQFLGLTIALVTPKKYGFPPWVRMLHKLVEGVSNKGNEVGWNKNTGAAAVNLAALFGAKNIFLLGYDMDLGKKGRSNWYENEKDEPREELYSIFLDRFKMVRKGMAFHFPDVKIINLNEKSKLNCFPKMNRDKFFNERKIKCL